MSIEPFHHSARQIVGELRSPDSHFQTQNYRKRNIRPRHTALCLILCITFAGCGNPVDKLIAQLESPDATARRAAARSLGEQTPPADRAVAALSKAVTDNDSDVRLAAIAALGQMGPAAKLSLPALKQALEFKDIAVGRKAAFAIQRIDPNDPSFQPVLIAAMREGHGQTLLAVGAMGKDASWAVPTLIGLLSHQEAKVRSLAAHTLGRIGPAARDAIAPLQRLLRDPNAAVRGAAQDALDLMQKANEPAAQARD